MTTRTVSVLLVVFFLWVIAWHFRSPKQRQALLLLASYLFYGSWGTGFLLVLIASSLLNYFWGSVLKRHVSAGWLWTGIALNLLLLIFFKYLPPLVGAGASDSWHSDLFRHIVMPVGISFWTFQALSYLFDIYREEELDPSLLEFCLYMAFWPTVLSGPVCRLPEMLPQLRQTRGFDQDDISVGTQRLLQGLIMKFALAQLLASGLAPAEGIDAGFDLRDEGLGALDVWVLAIGFGFQLFFDFAGYSHMAIGAARLFGIRLEENFNRPYFSTTPSMFWTRWHMSLSFWIRDYVFLPLAAMRRGRWWLYLMLISSMALFGLWHGAKATFILWGIYHGLLLVLHRMGQQMKRPIPLTWSPVLSGGTTFCLVSLGWIFFRANDLDQAVMMFGAVFSPNEYGHMSLPSSLYILIASVMAGYFGCEQVRSLLAGWRADYREELSVPSGAVVVVELLQLLRDRVWWWLAPMSLVALMIAGVVTFEQTAAVTPFMYTLF
jgi:alginate O-acetyltransferase complex protein AlgI